MAKQYVSLYRNYTDQDSTYIDNVYSAQTDSFPSPSDLSWDAPSGKAFKEWNTYRNGSGSVYAVGDTIPLSPLVFYAIWEDHTINKVVLGERTLIDLTSDTVTPETLVSGYTAHSRSGAAITGTFDTSVFVTTNTAQDITAEKTFLGSSLLKLKQSASNDASGFQILKNDGSVLVKFEYNNIDSIDTIKTTLISNVRTTSSRSETYLGFRYYNNTGVASGSSAYRLLVPSLTFAKSVFNLTLTDTNFYMPLGFTDGTTMVKTANSGLVDLSSILPAAQVNSDWNASSGVAQILNKPTLATVATSGSYEDLTNKPTIPAAQVNSDWDASSGVAQILNKPTLATVATSGSYNDLSNKPTIPSKNVWYGTCSTSAGTQIKSVTTTSQDFSLTTGSIVFVKFDNQQNYNGQPILNVDGTGDKNIVRNGTTGAVRYQWIAGETVGFVYDGTNFMGIDEGFATTTYYGYTKLSTSATSTSEALALTPRSLCYLVQNMIANYAVYSDAATYAVGDRVRRSYNVYECNTAISTAEAWDATHWTMIATVYDQIDNVRKSLYTIIDRTDIPANANLNTAAYTKCGKYYCNSTNGPTLTNSPITYGFVMTVENTAGSNMDGIDGGNNYYRRRVLYSAFSPNYMYVQICYSSSTGVQNYGSWVKMITSLDVYNGGVS